MRGEARGMRGVGGGVERAAGGELFAAQGGAKSGVIGVVFGGGHRRATMLR
jgi:hypothetical protein